MLVTDILVLLFSFRMDFVFPNPNRDASLATLQGVGCISSPFNCLVSCCSSSIWQRVEDLDGLSLTFIQDVIVKLLLVGLI